MTTTTPREEALMPGGRPRVGKPARELPPTGDRGARAASKQYLVRLGPGQPDEIGREAGRLVTSPAVIIRRAIDRLLSGQIPPPTRPEQIPPPLPSTAARTVTLGERGEQLEQLGDRIGDEVLRPAPVRPAAAGPRRRGRPPGSISPGTRRDALIRYAIATDLANERGGEEAPGGTV